MRIVRITTKIKATASSNADPKAVGSQDTGDNEIGTNNAGQQTANHEEAKKAGEFTTLSAT